MNSPMIRTLLGHVLKIEGALMLLPCLVAIIYQEKVGFIYLAVAGATALIGTALSFFKPANTALYLKEGCITTALSWIALSFFGCLPFCISGEIPSFTNALFETISGFTTTGASILNDVESLSHTALFWRSFTHWVGGMGVLVFLLAVVPLSGGSTINLLKAESPGPSVGKLVPKMKATARNLYSIYALLTLLQILFMLAGGCPAFDSITLSLGTAGTGGFGVRNDSLASYSPYIQWVVTFFMICFGVNFNFYYFLIMKRFKEAFHIEEVKYYLCIIIAAVIIIFLNIYRIFGSAGEALRHSAFQVASIITTSGFCTTDFDTWNTTCRMIIVLLMFIGACAGSTGGGIKVSRFVVMLKNFKREVNSYIHPKSVKSIMFEHKSADETMVASISVYLITFIMIFIPSLLLITLDNMDLTSSFTAVATTINNIGPGLNLIGPTRNFYELSTLSKYVLMFDMLAGRLELFPLLILFHPGSIKALITSRKKKKI
ncbi:MAG: TrkH family potassium uptake protein [Lachnospiraceae bacterium]|nr:TrkH family potassium uptake protein [Lachnospiraceae bacterium]